MSLIDRTAWFTRLEIYRHCHKPDRIVSREGCHCHTLRDLGDGRFGEINLEDGGDWRIFYM